MAFWVTVSAIAIFGTSTDAIPTIAFPVNSQVPPVARISEPFSYTFSNSTFSSNLALTYTLSAAPSWLSLDSSTRTISGTPPDNGTETNAVTGVNIELTASDQSGSVTLNATLVVSQNPAPVISIPLSAQLPSFGSYSSPSTILYHPSTPFTFNFEPGTFLENGRSVGLTYYSVTLENTPLPSWVIFDSGSLSFSGQTPDYYSLVQPPQAFGFQLIASDVAGFAGTSISFEIEVGVHLLAFKNMAMVINATAGIDVNFDGLSNSLELDGLVANLSSLTSIIAQTPSWLAFDNSTLELSGTVPADAISYNVTVLATDIYGDIAGATVFVNITMEIFDSQIGNFNVTIGYPFSYDLSSYFHNKSDVGITASFSPITSWISFDSQTFVLSGQVPSTVSPSNVGVTLVATSKSSGASSSQSFTLLVVAPPITVSTTSALGSHSSTSTTASTPSSDASPLSSVKPHKGLRSRIIAAIIVPTVLLFLAILLAMCCGRHRQRTAQKRRPSSPSKSEISAPLEGTSSAVENVTPPRIAAPEPLKLDMSGFTTEYSSSTYTNERKRKAKNLADNPLRRSQTMSAMSGALKSELRQSNSSRARAYSDNALSRTDRSWRSTQDSAYPTIGSSSRTNSSQRLTRNYSNYSRKGHTRRSERIRSADRALRDSTLSIQLARDSILNMGQGNYSMAPHDNSSGLSKHSSIQQTPQLAYSAENLEPATPATHKSKFVPGVDRRSGIGHGGRESISSLSRVEAKRRSIGHGQSWDFAGIRRDSRTWLTVNTVGANVKDRLSNVSNITENTEVLYADQMTPLRIKQDSNSPIPPPSARLSDSSVTFRRVGRRTIGSSPFFAGGSMRSSRKSPKKIRTSYADSPTVPEDTMLGSLGTTVMQGLRDESPTPRDSFGIYYGSTHEGTRQLRSYIHSQMVRAKTSGSVESNESMDSRFESADSRHPSQQNVTIHAQKSGGGRREEWHGYDRYLPDDYSDGSWETHHTPRDSMGNILEYSVEESPEVVMAATARRTLVPGTALRSHPTSPMPPETGPKARMTPGRPVSVGTGEKATVRAVVESDYTAYV